MPFAKDIDEPDDELSAEELHVDGVGSNVTDAIASSSPPINKIVQPPPQAMENENQTPPHSPVPSCNINELD